jgi:hypothetical protein
MSRSASVLSTFQMMFAHAPQYADEHELRLALQEAEDLVQGDPKRLMADPMMREIRALCAEADHAMTRGDLKLASLMVVELAEMIGEYADGHPQWRMMAAGRA